MKQFFKYLLASIVGFFIASFLVFLFFLAIVAMSAGSFAKEKAVSIEANSILKLNLNYEIPEKTNENPFANLDFSNLEGEKKIGLNDIIKNIEKAKNDDDIKGIYIEMEGLPNGLATVKAIRDALIDFKESEKFVIAYGEMITQRNYYLASVADEIYLNPKGYLDFRGLGTQLAFFKGTLDKLDIDMQIFKVGTYKSAIEPFTREEMSDSNKLQVRYLLDDIYEGFLADISDQRGMSPEQLHDIANKLSARNPKGAVETDMIDDLKYFDEVLDMMKERVGIEKDKKLKLVQLKDYQNVKGDHKKELSKDKIAVIFASGGIVDGEGDEDQIGSKRFAKEIRKIRQDDKVKGIVLRVNSGGGSALASEVIWRELQVAKKDKPVVVSMGDVAASGGYYIACGADKIFAEPNTVTGSIGVFGLIPNMEGFFNQKLGMTFDEVETANYSVFGGGPKPVSEEEGQFIQEGVDSVYDNFTSRVAQGRDLKMDKVLSIAEGRIWTGNQALERGLVDELGSLNDAIAAVAEMAELESYSIRNYPKAKDPFEMLMKGLTSSTRQSILKNELGPYYGTYEMIKNLKDINRIQTRIPFVLEIN